MYVDVDNLTINIQLDDDSYGGQTSLLRCFQSKTVIGYEKFIYKKNANYLIFKSNNKKFVSVFTNPNWSYKDGNSDDNIFEINLQFIFRGNEEKNYGRGDLYLKNGKNIKDDYSGKGVNIFADKFLPTFFDSVDYRGDEIIFGYIDTKEKITIPKSPYGSVKKSFFKS